MAQGVRIPLTMTDQTRGAVNAARNNVKRLSMDAQRAGQSIGRATGRAGSVAGRVGTAMGSSVGGRLGGVGGALGGMMALGPLGLAIGGAAAGLSMFTKAMEKSAEAVQNQLAGERAMRSARERGQSTIQGQQRGAAGRLGVMQEAAGLGLGSQDMAFRTKTMPAEDVVAIERARQGGMSHAQLVAAHTLARLGIVPMQEALSAVKSLGRNATAEDLLLRVRGQQLSGSARAAAATEIVNIQAFREGRAGDTIRAQQHSERSALMRDTFAIQGGSTARAIDEQTRLENDPMQAESERALDELRRAYSDAWEYNKRLHEVSGRTVRAWRRVFGSSSEKAAAVARVQYMAAQAQ